MSKVKINAVGVEDAELIRQLAIQTFSESFAEYNTAENMRLYIQRNFSNEIFKSELENENFLFLVIEYRNTPAGYIKIKFNAKHPEIEYESSIEIERFYILREFQRKGIGRKAMNYIIDLAKAHDYETLWLGVWEHNHNAIAFYETMGFNAFSHQAFIPGNDIQNDICYKLTL